MHQQPPTAPFSPNRSSSAGHRSGVSGRIVSFMLPSLSSCLNSRSYQNMAGPLFGTQQTSLTQADLHGLEVAKLAIFDPHIGRNTAKAALTSSSLAASPASPSSIAAHSSGVASYSALASSASI